MRWPNSLYRTRFFGHKFELDSFGGLVGFAATQGKRKPKLPLYIGGEGCFCSRQFTAGPTPLNLAHLIAKR